jgi:hypothetical protein
MMVIGLFVTGCVTPFDQPQVEKGGYGYREIAINQDVYFLEFRGNVSTSLSTASKYWYLRADELCAPKGQVVKELYVDPFSQKATRTAPSDMAIGDGIGEGFIFATGESLGSGYLHSKFGFFRCVAPNEVQR